MAARPLWRASLAAGCRSARCRRQAVMTLPGKSRAPMSIRSGPPTATATIISSIGVVSGTSYGVGIVRAHFRPGLERRRSDRATTTVIQTERLVWIDQPDRRFANNYFLDNSSGSGPDADNMTARPLWRVSLAAGCRSARCRRQAVMTLPGKFRAPMSIRSGAPTATATISQVLGVVSGTSYALESFEPIFGQDLNGDGVIGAPDGDPDDTGSFGSTSLTAGLGRLFP